MAALFGVLSVVNVYTGTMFDIIFIYLMTVALAYYTFKFNAKMAVRVLFTSTFILFLTGELFFTLYSFFTLPLGILYIYCIKKNIGHKLNCMDFIIKPAIWLSISMLCCYLIRYIFSFCNSETRLYSYFSNGVCAVVLAGVFSFFFYTYWKNIKQV